jgi:hypothetical protein
MTLLLLLCACTCPGVERRVEIVTLESVSVYDLWLWEQSGDYEDGYTWDHEAPQMFGPEYYYPEEQPSAVDAEIDPVP